jgi:GTPase SAR1 family protein
LKNYKNYSEIKKNRSRSISSCNKFVSFHTHKPHTSAYGNKKCSLSRYYRNALGAFIVFDITNPYSFHNTTKWLDELSDNIDGNYITTLVYIFNY